MGVRRIYVEKKPEFAVRARELKEAIVNYLGIQSIESVRVLIRYDIEDMTDRTYEKSCGTIFSEPPLDNLTQDHWEVKQIKRTFIGIGTYRDEESTVTLDAAEILPGQVAFFYMIIHTPSDSFTAGSK